MFIAGGEQIYHSALPLADKICLTEVRAVLEGDTFFPELNPQEWLEVRRAAHASDEKHAYAYDFVELTKVHTA